MVALKHLSFIAFLASSVSPPLVLAGRASPAEAILESKYTKAHYLGDDYVFNERDGWYNVNATNLEYKYPRRRGLVDASRKHGNHTVKVESHGVGNKNVHHPKPQGGKSGLGGTLGKVLGDAFKGLKGLGKPQPVTITWYTGHDLQNPSCWKKSGWAPTDESFAAALTMEGWKDKPKCFKFLELCNSAKQCVFVRVVDTCAGCAKGTKHVDLTRAAFGELAEFETGMVQVHFRLATDPEHWYEKLWGPKNPLH